MISLPLQLLALGWAVGLALQRPRNEIGEVISWWMVALQFLIGGLAIGVLRATNTWDWPTYLVIGSLAVMFQAYRRHAQVDVRLVGEALLQVLVLLGLSVITFWPYASNYGVGYTSASLWPGSYTFVSNYLAVYGLFLFFIVTFLAIEFRAWSRSWSMEQLAGLEPLGRPILLALVAYLGVLLALVWRGYWVAPLALTLIVVATVLGLRPGIDASRRISLILAACALGLTLLVELFVLDGDIGRMNTVFKFYMQVWLILSVVSGATGVWSWQAIRRRGGRVRRIWQAAAVVLVAAAALYPFLATQAKWDVRMSKEAPNTLDGMAFMPYVEYGDTDYAGNSVTIALDEEYQALRWMQRNIEGSPVVAEAHSTNPYRSIGNRVAMYTGLPAIIGWDWHQRQQRAVVPETMVRSRIEDVQKLFNTPDVTEAQAILDRYDVRLIYVGTLERNYYAPEGIEKFERMAAAGQLITLYESAGSSTGTGVTIYAVPDSAET
jgi:YYY domain-containing protein